MKQLYLFCGPKFKSGWYLAHNIHFQNSLVRPIFYMYRKHIPSNSNIPIIPIVNHLICSHIKGMSHILFL